MLTAKAVLNSWVSIGALTVQLMGLNVISGGNESAKPSLYRRVLPPLTNAECHLHNFRRAVSHFKSPNDQISHCAVIVGHSVDM